MKQPSEAETSAKEETSGLLGVKLVELGARARVWEEEEEEKQDCQDALTTAVWVGAESRATVNLG